LVDPSKLPKWMYGVLPGMIWPPRAKEFKFIFKADIMISSQMVHTYAFIFTHIILLYDNIYSKPSHNICVNKTIMKFKLIFN
jgi:hypothetical protein